MTEKNTDECIEDAQPADVEGPQSISEAVEAMSSEQAATFRLVRLGGVHLMFWILALGLFAAADSWRMLSDFGFASFLSLVTGVLAGVVTTTLIHEWFHYLGARRSKGAYTIPDKLGVFVYDCTKNKTRQCARMHSHPAHSVCRQECPDQD